MSFFDISPDILKLADEVTDELRERFAQIDATAQYNTEKVLSAFQKYKVSDGCFAGTTGYGYDDKGRDTLEQIYAEVFGTQSALVRIGLVNGTHAITAALFSNLRPGDILLSASGLPYDTLQSTIGISGDYPGSLRYYNIGYKQTDLTPEGKIDYEKLKADAADSRVKAVEIQRSRGYSSRDAFSVEEIGRACEIVHEVNPDAAVIVDNCYGEFVEKTEPTQVGADLMAGSLIKNPGGGIAPMGGYIVGRKDLVEAAAYHMTSPGIGGEVGATVGNNRLLYQGFFMAPHVTAQALKTAVFCAGMLERSGYKTSPSMYAERSDIIQTVEFNDPEMLRLYCRGIQFCSPVDSYVTPEPWEMPGYDCPVIMAAGAFIQGSSIELSADGPMRPPYTVYQQGGLTFESGKIGVMKALDMMKNGKTGK